MNRSQSRRFSLLTGCGFGLSAALLCGCPARPSCPNCGFHTVTYSVNAEDVDGLQTATMHTYVDHPDGECPDGECVTDRTDDITCKLRGAEPGTKEQVLPVQSADGANYRVTIDIRNTKGTRPTIEAAVGGEAPEAPPKKICP